MGLSLQGKRALVTGGSRGIGAAIVQRLAREGAEVAFTYVSQPDRAEQTAAAVRALGRKALAIQADSANAEAVTAAVERTVAELGGLEILVSNAGVASFEPFDQLSLADFDRTFAINVRAAFVASQAAAKHLGQGGRIIVIGSCMAERAGVPGAATYVMTKAALVGLVKGMARDLGPRGITVNNVQPGPIETEMNPASGDFADMLRNQFLAIPRYGTADEVASLVAHLAGPESSYITGASLSVDGGFTA